MEAGDAMIVAGELVAGARVAGARVAGEAAPPTPDPLSGNSDNFNGSSLAAAWTEYNGGGVSTVTVTGDQARISADHGGTGQAFWYNDQTADLYYKLITGDFDVYAYLTLTNEAEDGLPPVSNYRICGLAAHDPDRSSVLNYVHIGLGSVGAAALACEWKDTRDSVSLFGSTTNADIALGRGQIRLRRVGEVYDFFYRSAEGLDWILVQTRGRSGAELPAQLQVGFMLYSNVDALDIRGRFDFIHYSTP